MIKNKQNDYFCRTFVCLLKLLLGFIIIVVAYAVDL